MFARYLMVAVAASLIASPAVAGKWHSATKPTQEEAMRAATKLAKDRAKKKRTCYKPAWIEQVTSTKPCRKAPGGVTCWATSANEPGSCENGKYGWLSPGPVIVYEIPPIPVYPELPSLPRPRNASASMPIR
jgi:hypothetical protein